MSYYWYWGYPWGSSSTTTTTTTFAPTTTQNPSHSSLLNTIGIVAAVAACVVFAAVVLALALCLRKAYAYRAQQQELLRHRRSSLSATAAAAGVGSTSDEQQLRGGGRERTKVYKGVPIYPTTQLADGDEVVFVPALEDLPEATPASMPRLRQRPAPAPSAPPISTTSHSATAVASTLTSVPNPLSRTTLSNTATAGNDGEAYVGVVVPDVSEEDQNRGEGRWYRQRDYGSAVYYSQPPPQQVWDTNVVVTDLE